LGDASIMDALANCRVMILVWSTNSDTSKQVKREIAIALDDIGISLIHFRFVLPFLWLAIPMLFFARERAAITKWTGRGSPDR
jgi:hypothetical protein